MKENNNSISETPKVDLDLKNYIILEGRVHQGNRITEKQSYNDMLVSIYPYRRNYTYPESVNVLEKEQAYGLRLRQFVDFLKLLRTGKAYNGEGKIIPEYRINKIYSKITNGKKRHTEWIIGNFENKKSNGERDDSSTLSLISKDYVRNEHIEIPNQIGFYVGMNTDIEIFKGKFIDMDDWINRADWLGFPPRDVKEGLTAYLPPTSEQQYRFCLTADGQTQLRCCRDNFAYRDDKGRFNPCMNRALIRPVYYVNQTKN